MKERPILFSGPMVCALLRDENPKTQTRRVLKVQPDFSILKAEYQDPDLWEFRKRFMMYESWHGYEHAMYRKTEIHPDMPVYQHRSPYGEPGDRLYVRETWQHSNHPLGPYEPDCAIFYRADYFDDPHGPDGELSPEGRYREWRPSIHMPRTASRITLEITDVRIERLKDISVSDAIAEGLLPYAIYGGKVASWKGCKESPAAREDAREAYFDLWDTINDARGYGVNVNPWTWVVEFRRVR